MNEIMVLSLETFIINQQRQSSECFASNVFRNLAATEHYSMMLLLQVKWVAMSLSFCLGLDQIMAATEHYSVMLLLQVKWVTMSLSFCLGLDQIMAAAEHYSILLLLQVKWVSMSLSFCLGLDKINVPRWMSRGVQKL